MQGGLKRRGERFLEVRKVLETLMQDTGDCPREKAVGCGSRTCSCGFRVTSKRVLCLGVLGAGRFQGQKENVNNLDTKGSGKREVISSCASGVRNNPCDHLERRGCCNFGTNDEREQQ